MKDFFCFIFGLAFAIFILISIIFLTIDFWSWIGLPIPHRG